MKNYEIINRLFSSKIRTKLLDIFLSSPESRYYIRELERKIKEEAKNISRELQNLETIGLLFSEKQGNQKIYAVNEDFFLYPELKGLIYKTTGVFGVLKNAMFTLKGVEAAFIYGSYATGKETQSSDVDLLVVGKLDLTELNDVINELEVTLNREINYICFDREEFEERKKLKDAFLLEVLSNNIMMLKGSKNAL